MMEIKEIIEELNKYDENTDFILEQSYAFHPGGSPVTDLFRIRAIYGEKIYEEKRAYGVLEYICNKEEKPNDN